MAHDKFLKRVIPILLFAVLATFSIPASAATVILNFDWLDPGTTHHGPAITESGYTLSTDVDIRSVKPADFNSNGTVSLFTEQQTPVTITYGLTNNLVFDIISMDFGLLFGGSGTPIVSYSATRADNSVVSGQLVLSGEELLWTYHIEFSSLFTNLVSFRLGYVAPFSYQFDNIELSSSIDIHETPIPGAISLYLCGIAAIGFAAYRRRPKKNITIKS